MLHGVPKHDSSYRFNGCRGVVCSTSYVATVVKVRLDPPHDTTELLLKIEHLKRVLDEPPGTAYHWPPGVCEGVPEHEAGCEAEEHHDGEESPDDEREGESEYQYGHGGE